MGCGEAPAPAGGGASKEPEKLAISDTAATTAAELGAQLAEQVMGAVHKVLNQFEGAGSTTLAACGTKLAACEAILKSMQEKVTELQQLKQVMENKSSWMLDAQLGEWTCIAHCIWAVLISLSACCYM